MKLDGSTALGVLARPLLFGLYGLSGLWPRRARRWVFGSWSGQRFADNAAALYEHVCRHVEEIEAIWITRNREVQRQLRGRGRRAYLAWSPHGMWYCATAGVYVFDGLTKDINHWLSRGARRVLLRHGVGIKRVERAIEQPGHRLYQLFHGTAPQRLFWSWLLPWHLVRPDLAIATSPEHARQAGLYYDIGPERVVVTGFPRNDVLFSARPPAELPASLRDAIGAARAAGRPVVLYLPTFRDDETHSPLPARLAQLDALAGALGVLLLVKAHFVDGQRHGRLGPGGFRHLVLVDAGIDANSMFGLVDALVSDYSSAVYDFLLTGRPVIYYIPDLAEYQRFSRSLLYDFDRIAPGPRATTPAELGALLARLGDAPDTLRDPRYAAVLDLFHTFRDAGAAQRAADEIRQRFVVGGTREAAPAIDGPAGG